MIRTLKFFGALAVVLGVASAIVYFVYPGVLLNVLQSTTASGAGLEKKSINLEGYTAHYYESGTTKESTAVNTKTLVLVHGLGDDKNSFVTSVRELSNDYRVILPDLQAHGENTQTPGRDYSIAGQAKFLNKLLGSLGADSFVIGGNSMGGHTAAAYAARYPSKIKGLILLNATGMQLETESVYRYYPESVDTDFFKTMFNEIFVNPPSFPEPIIQHMVNTLNPKIPFFNELVKQVENGNDFRMNEKAQTIQAPSLMLWGKQDPIVGLAYAQQYEKNLAKSELVILENAGHSPQLEVPERIQTEIKTFLKSTF